MQKISNKTESRLLRCVELASEIIENGEDPNTGIAKAAQQIGVGPGELRLVVQAYNTGRTIRQREDNDDLMAKAADFPLADTAAVLEILYPDKEKTAAARQAVDDSRVSLVYSFSPKAMLQRRDRSNRGEQKRLKLAWNSPEGEEITATERYPRDPGAAMKRAHGNVERAQKAAEEARRLHSRAMGELGDHFESLKEYFHRPGSTALPVVKEAVILMHGDKGERVMDELIRYAPHIQMLPGQKRAFVLPETAHELPAVHTLDCTAEPFPTIVKVLDSITDCRLKKAAADTAQLEFERIREEQFSPFCQPAVSNSVLGPSLTEEKRATSSMNPFSNPLLALTQAKVLGDIIGKIDSQGKDQRKALVEQDLMKLDDPSHLARMNQINSQTMMQDFMINDPVISGYDPSEVTDAYNSIVQMSPRSADKRLLMQTMLRKQLQQGALDNFDVDQLLQMDDRLRKRETPVEFKGGGGDGSVL